MIIAQWGTEYDWRNDKIYKAPIHLECQAPIYKHNDTYYCVGCGRKAQVDGEMIHWLKEREGEKIKIETCISCGEKTMETHYHRNHNTKAWETGYGECKSCGCKFIV